MVGPAVSVRPDLAQLWAWLGDVPDPEIPVVSVVDLGIVRDVCWVGDDVVRVTVTPTYSGCPATEVIGGEIVRELKARGVAQVELRLQLAPAWTTDWLSEEGKRKLLEYGIAPPVEEAATMAGDALEQSLVVLGQGAHRPKLRCPRCGSERNEVVSRFGSTPCKSLHRCLECLEPFDHFKCH